MSSLRWTSDDSGYNGLRMTAEGFFALGETDQRVELVDGVVVMSPSPLHVHQQMAFLVLGQLYQLIASGVSLLVCPETDVRLAPTLVYRPDISIYRRARVPGRPSRLTLPPDLIIEILSPGSKAMDLVTKKDDYQRHGVGEYWVIDPETVAVACWALEGGGYAEVGPVGDAMASRFIDGLRIELAPLRAGLPD